MNFDTPSTPNAIRFKHGKTKGRPCFTRCSASRSAQWSTKKQKKKTDCSLKPQKLALHAIEMKSTTKAQSATDPLLSFTSYCTGHTHTHRGFPKASSLVRPLGIGDWGSYLPGVLPWLSPPPALPPPACFVFRNVMTVRAAERDSGCHQTGSQRVGPPDRSVHSVHARIYFISQNSKRNGLLQLSPVKPTLCFAPVLVAL